MGSKGPQRVWQVRVGNDGCIGDDTVSLEPEPLEIESTLDIAERRGRDPYSNVPPQARKQAHRRTLDDMRKLDQEIKRGRPIQPAVLRAPCIAAPAKRSALRDYLARWFGKARN